MKCNCKGRIIEADGELVCSRCGVIHGYSTEDTPTQPAGVKADVFGRMLSKASFNTTMGQSRVDHLGHMTSNAYRLQRTNTWCRKYNRSTPTGMALLSKMRDELGLSEAVTEYAVYLFRKTAASGFLIGRTLSYCVAAITLLACRKHGLNRTLDDIAHVSGTRQRSIYRVYRQLCEKYSLVLPIPDPVAHISRIGGQVGISEATRRDAIQLLATLNKTEVAGKGPAGLAAGALYMACINRGEMVLRHEIAVAAGVAETTLAKRYAIIRKTVD